MWRVAAVAPLARGTVLRFVRANRSCRSGLHARGHGPGAHVHGHHRPAAEVVRMRVPAPRHRPATAQRQSVAGGEGRGHAVGAAMSGTARSLQEGGWHVPGWGRALGTLPAQRAAGADGAAVPSPEEDDEDDDDDEEKEKKSTKTGNASKVERTLATVRAMKEDELANLNYASLVEDKPDVPVKPQRWLERHPIHTGAYWSGLWKDVKEWAHHMKMGAKLLWTDTKIASSLLWRVLNGGKLSRRERRQFVRTLSDLFRLVPFSVFIIVPFGELALPFAMRIFPGLLPSQFRHQNDEEAKRVAELKVKVEMATFLQETVESFAAERKDSKYSEELREFVDLLEKGRVSPTLLQTSEIMRFATLFNDMLTLENLTRQQLVALNKLLLMPTIGTDAVLSFQLRYRLKRLHADDLLIQSEGVDSLSVPELQTACRERGMRALGISEEGLRARLQQWLHLSLVENVPASLLLLSRILYLPEAMDTRSQIAATIEQLPDMLKHEAKIAAMETEGGKVSAEERLQIIAEQQALIEKEKQEALDKEEAQKLAIAAAAAAEARKLAEAAAAAEDLATTAAEEQKKMGEFLESAKHTESGTVVRTDDDGFLVTEELPRPPEKKEKPREPGVVKDLTPEEMVQLTVVLSEMAKTDALKELKREHTENIEDMKTLEAEGAGEIELPRVSIILSKQVSKILSKVEGSAAPDKASPDDDAITLDLSTDGLVSTEELLASLKRCVSPENEFNLRRLIHIIDADHDGVVKVETLQKIMTAIAEEGIDDLMKIEGDNALNMVVEAIEREERANEAMSKKAKKEKKEKKKNEEL